MLVRKSRSNSIFSQEDQARFRRTVLSQARRVFRPMPWRETTDPYKILVSEIMLQQTQVPRVLVKYAEFVREFPTIHVLAAAPVARVVKVWLGLGYNRRALALHRAAGIVVETYGGAVPREVAILQTLPGIGHATACAVAAFAYNQPVVFIETNVRSVYLHHFFPGRQGVGDWEILPLVEATLDTADPRGWYWALMDYGRHLKSAVPNPSRRSARHRRQSAFQGSHRQLRGRILRHLAHHGSVNVDHLAYALGAETEGLVETVRELRDEGFVAVDPAGISLRVR